MFFLVTILLYCCNSLYAGLYNSSDPLVILSSKNFYEEILETKNGWIIEFYNTYCGHCITFAPTWKNFSMEVKDWSHTFKVAAIDCSNEENIPICRDYEVMAYPTIQLFGHNTQKGEIGTSVHSRTVPELKSEVVKFIGAKQMQGQGSDSWVNLLEYKDLIKNIFNYAPTDAQHSVLVVDSSEDNGIGNYTILDLGMWPKVYVRRSQKSGVTKEIRNLGISSFPALIFVYRSGKREIFTENVATSKQATKFIRKHLKLEPRETILDSLKRHITPKYPPSPSVDKDDREGAGDGQPDEISSDRLSYDDELPDSAFRNPSKDQVYMVDIENAISFALKREVTLHRIITGEHLKALREFLDALVNFLPARPQIHQFLLKLRNFVAQEGKNLTAKQLEKRISLLRRSSSSVLPEMQPWIGCLGSKPHYRGFPCGLWTLFHTLTVNALLTSEEKENYDPQRPLQAIHGYVKYFFSCRECSKHFQEMYALDAESFVRAPGDEVTWLWSAHNKVNKRLKGKLSEDPTHPKIQFPPKTLCSTCWTEEDIPHRNEVLQYLKTIYGRGSLSLKGTKDLTSKKTGDKEAIVIHPPRISNDSAGQEVLISSTKNSWKMNTLDLNLCILLYFFSTFIMVCAYLLFVLKRKLRRKNYFDFYKLP